MYMPNCLWDEGNHQRKNSLSKRTEKVSNLKKINALMFQFGKNRKKMKRNENYSFVATLWDGHSPKKPPNFILYVLECK